MCTGSSSSESEFAIKNLSRQSKTSGSGLDLEREIVDGIHRRLLKEFMDVVIMGKMRNMDVNGYNIITYLHKEFDFLVSSGTIYSVLYSMERDGLIKGKRVNRKRIYTLTRKGEATIKTIRDTSDVFENFLARLLKTE
jgi:DNA-binding PadR family transcriptional regulator